MNRTILLILTISIHVVGCAGNQKQIRGIESCERDLTSSQYTIDSLKAQNERHDQVQEAPPPITSSTDAWREAYSELAIKCRQALDGIAYNIYVKAGALVISFPMEHFFLSGKTDLTVDGENTTYKLASVISPLDRRHIVIASRSTDFEVIKRSATVASNRELAVQRAAAVVSALERLGVGSVNLIAAGYGTGPAEKDVVEEGIVEVIIQPLQHELPDFPLAQH